MARGVELPRVLGLDQLGCFRKVLSADDRWPITRGVFPVQNRFRIWTKVLLATVLLIGAIGWGYHLASPKVELHNFSDQSFGEFILQLPDNRVSFGPVAPQSLLGCVFHPNHKTAR